MNDPEQTLKELKLKANKLPQSPGVYIMKDKSDNIIYIGKAKSLKNRVTQYFGKGSAHSEKVRRMVSNVSYFEYIICDSEYEALVLECSLIKQHQPKYNILLKDDKGYHYIKITDDKWPKIEFSNTIDNKGEFIGPYYSAYVARDTIDTVHKIFKLPDCNRSFDKYSKPCLNFHIGRCDAPCRAKISRESYLETVNLAKEYIKNGNSADLISILTEKMNAEAEKLNFEYAAKLRDRINALNGMKKGQKVVMCTYKSQDVFASIIAQNTACVSVLVFRNSRLVDKKHYFFEGVSDKESLYGEFLTQYYFGSEDIPPRILLDSDFDGITLTEQWLAAAAKRKVKILIPKAGEQKDIVAMCRNNAADNISYRLKKSGKETAVLNELATLLGLKKVPQYIEAYDISHTAGDQNVGAMVVFKDGKPLKSAYKKFKIKGFTGQDDYRSLAQVIERRLEEYKNGTDEGFKTLPDLILLDGGSGQVSAVAPVLEKYNLGIALFGMVKDSKHRTRAIAKDGGNIALKSNRSVYTLITAIQDEVHRFAIGYHRKKRTKKMLSSELTTIEGVGEKRVTVLLKAFKTVKAIKEATVEELSAVKGITKPVAQKIFDFYHSDN